MLRPGPARLAAWLIGLGLLAAGCGGGQLPGEDRSGEAVKLFFTGGEQFRPVKTDLTVSESTLPSAARELVEGPPPGRRSGTDPVQTQIPAGTEVERVEVSDGEAEIELSSEFLKGVPADPGRRSRDQQDELDARLGQLTYTLTQFGEVHSARVLAAGREVAPSLDRTSYARPLSAPAPLRKPLGAKDPGIRRVQKRLWRLGYLPKAAIDGLDGYRTQQAVTAFQAWEGLERDGVAGPATKAALAKARRPKPRRGGPPKRIEVHRERGVALLVKEGRTKRAVHVSAGAAGTETPPGSFEVFRKELNSWSVPFSTWLPYASYFNQGIAFHEYAEVPPFPASHGCVRVPDPEAEFVYSFAAIGTPVRVF